MIKKFLMLKAEAKKMNLVKWVLEAPVLQRQKNPSDCGVDIPNTCPISACEMRTRSLSWMKGEIQVMSRVEPQKEAKRIQAELDQLQLELNHKKTGSHV